MKSTESSLQEPAIPKFRFFGESGPNILHKSFRVNRLSKFAFVVVGSDGTLSFEFYEEREVHFVRVFCIQLLHDSYTGSYLLKNMSCCGISGRAN